MPKPSSPSAVVRFLDYDAVLRALRRAAAAARKAHPEIVRVLLFGSLARGDWTADSDADLIVVVRNAPRELLARARYQIHTPAIPTDTLVYSEEEFERFKADPSSFLSQNLEHAIEL